MTRLLTAVIEDVFTDFSEVAHGHPTFMRGTYISCIDRVFATMPQPLLYDLKPTAHPVWTFGDRLGKASDRNAT